MKSKKLATFLVVGLFFGSFISSILLYQMDWNSRIDGTESELDKFPDQLTLGIQDEVTANTLSGIGEYLDIGLYANVSGIDSLNNPYAEGYGIKYYDLPIDTNYLNITYTNLTFSGITAQNATIIIEENPEYFLPDDVGGQAIWVATSIKIPAPCKLREIQLFVQDLSILVPPDWNISIYNATRDLKQDFLIVPHVYTGISTVGPGTDLFFNVAAHWQNFTFPEEPQLNVSDTYIDSNGFAYYYLVIFLPSAGAGIERFLYYSFDDFYIDDSITFYGYGLFASYLEVDPCLKINLAPLSSTPSPADVSLGVVNPNRPSLTNLSTELDHSIPVAAAYNYTNASQVLAQNFTLTDFGTIHSICLYLKFHGDTIALTLSIFPDNGTGFPSDEPNSLIDMNITLFIPDTTTGWINFTMVDTPNLAPGEYWWLIACESLGNITLYGADDASGDNAIALNITVTETDGGFDFSTEELPVDFAAIIYYQPGKHYYNVSKDWISESCLIPDVFGYYHFTILTRWFGATTFNVNYIIELENNQETAPCYNALYNEETIWWNITLNPTFPITGLGKIINVTIPIDWDVHNVTKNGMDHGSNNWTIQLIGNRRLLSIFNASDGWWTVWCNSTIYSSNFIIEKLVGSQFQPAVDATVYDRLRVNVTINGQTNGNCFLSVFYPDGESSFMNQTIITSENALISWNPENDSRATGGNYTFVVHWSNGTEVGYNLQYFFFTPIPANITLISNLPTPYVDDTTQSLVIRYNDSRGINITGATLSSDLYGIPLEWEDIYATSLNPKDAGKYRIKLNTTGLNSSQSYALNMWAYKDGYENVTFSPQQIDVMPVPTLLVTNVENLTQYENEPISFSCSFKDTFHGIDIDWASVNYTIIGTSINGSMVKIMPGESVYSAEDIPLTNLLGRGTPYLINITAEATNCEAYFKTIDLFVVNKTRTILIISELAGSFIQGRELRIEATLRNSSSGEGIPNATIRFTFGGVILDQIAITNQEGVAIIEISIPAQSFSIQAWFDETSSIASASTSGETISVMTYMDIGLWIGLIAAACVVTVLAARQFYFKPKKNRKLQEFQKIANKFQDIANLRHLLIVHGAAGTCMYQQSFGSEVDGQLISGFLSAISTFQTELKPGKLPQMAVKTGGFELNYQDYKILLFKGNLINLALIVDATPSDEFRERAQLLVQEYERKYHDSLVVWRGDVSPFKTSHVLIADILELSLVWPHQLNRPMSMDSVSSLEASLIQIADTVMKSQATSYFFLPMIISVGQASQPKKKLEVIADIYNLHKLNIFNPINLETISG